MHEQSLFWLGASSSALQMDPQTQQQPLTKTQQTRKAYYQAHKEELAAKRRLKKALQDAEKMLADPNGLEPTSHTQSQPQRRPKAQENLVVAPVIEPSLPEPQTLTASKRKTKGPQGHTWVPS